MLVRYVIYFISFPLGRLDMRYLLLLPILLLFCSLYSTDFILESKAETIESKAAEILSTDNDNEKDCIIYLYKLPHDVCLSCKQMDDWIENFKIDGNKCPTIKYVDDVPPNAQKKAPSAWVNPNDVKTRGDIIWLILDVIKRCCDPDISYCWCGGDNNKKKKPYCYKHDDKMKPVVGEFQLHLRPCKNHDECKGWDCNTASFPDPTPTPTEEKKNPCIKCDGHSCEPICGREIIDSEGKAVDCCEQNKVACEDDPECKTKPPEDEVNKPVVTTP
jgi:hypothetical protein